MNHAPHLDAAITALTVLADYLHPGWTADPAWLLTAAEMGCDHTGLPEDQAPAVTAIASFWIALATASPPASPGPGAADRNLAGLPGHHWEQAAALRRAAQMLRDWIACLAPATPGSRPSPDGLTTRPRRPQRRTPPKVRKHPMHVMLYGSYTRKPYRQATSGEIEQMLSAPRLDHSCCPPGRGGDVFIAPAVGDEGFWPAWHARHPQPPVPAGRITSQAADLGRDAGKAAASWVFDGNTPEDAYRAVLAGIEDGDPAILDAHPAPGLSAGGGYTEADLADDLGLDGADQLPPDAVTAYLDAADQAFWHETERLAREHLAAADETLDGETGKEPSR